MTGGQVAPTSPKGIYAHTAPYGNIDNPFDGVDLAVSAGATYVARSTNYHTIQSHRYIKKAIERRGFSFVEIMSQCPVLFGRLNKYKSPADMLRWQKEAGVRLSRWEKLSKEEKEGKFPIGEFHIDDEKPEYAERYLEMCQQVREEAVNGEEA